MNKDKALKVFAPFENIIFDYGGIFVNLDYKKTVHAFQKLNEDIDFESFFSKHNQTPIFNLLETGKITKAEYLLELKRLLKIQKVSDQKVIDAWCAMLQEIPVERVNFLREIRKTKKVFMLSNINQIHEDFVKEYLALHHSIQDFYSLFDRIYFSHHIGIRKPDREVFEYVCSNSSLNLKKTIFIDDSIQHIESASKFGLSTYHLDPSNSFICD